MPENLLLADSYLANPNTFCWLEKREQKKGKQHVRPAPACVPPYATLPNFRFPSSEYRDNITTEYVGRRSKISHEKSPFSGLTFDIKLYKSTDVHYKPTLTAKDSKKRYKSSSELGRILKKPINSHPEDFSTYQKMSMNNKNS
jgi:hypothetical protein